MRPRQRQPYWAGFIFGALCAAGSAPGQVLNADNDPDAIALRSRPITDDEFRLPLEATEAVRIDALVTQLAGPDYAERQKAATEITEIGARAFAKLRDAYRQADDLETRLRIEEVVRSAYLNLHVLDQHGFLGISMRWVDPTVLDQVRGQGAQGGQAAQAIGRVQLPPGRVGVLVQQVIPNTGAARAGVQVGDVLIGLDRKPVEGTGQAIQDSFSALIREHPPGAEIELEVLRGAEVRVMTAVLSRPPENVARDSRIIKITPLFHVVSERFRTWWSKYFVEDPDAVSGMP